MTTVSGTFTMEEPHLGFIDKLASYVAWALGGAIFFTMGWIALEPIDPLGPISLLAGRGALGMVVEASLLAAVAASIGTVIIGRKLPDAGTFAAALGLGIVSLRGGTMEFLLLRTADHPEASVRGLALGLAVESIGWSVVILAAIVTSAILSRWFWKPPTGSDISNPSAVSGGSEGSTAALAGWDVPLIGVPLGRHGSWIGTSPVDGLRHVAIGAIVILAAHLVFATGLHDRVITHGQACFVIAASVCTGIYFAFRFAPVRSALWSVLAVVVSSIAGYLVSAILPGEGATTSTLPANIPRIHFLRTLPVQSIAVGCAAAVAMFWWRFAMDFMLQNSAERPVDISDRSRIA